MVRSETPARIRPLPLWQAAFCFAVPAVLLFLSIYRLVPRLIALGLAPYVSLDVAFLVPFALLFGLSLAAYARAGRAWSWASFRDRYRLGRMGQEDWLWTAGLLGFTAVVYLPLRAILLRLVGQGIIPIPDSLPAMLDPRAQQSVESLMGGARERELDPGPHELECVVLQRPRGGAVVAAYLLPRQEAAHGRRAWVAHGLLWRPFHAFKYR